MAYGLSIRNRIEIFAESMGIDEEEFERQCGLPEDAIAGRAGIHCAGALCVGVRGPWRVSLASWEPCGQEGKESLLRGK